MRFISGKSQKGFWSPCKSLSRVLCLTYSPKLFCWKEVRQERRQDPRRSKSGNAVSCLGPWQSPVSTLDHFCPQVYINLLGTHPGFLWGFQINMVSFKKRGKISETIWVLIEAFLEYIFSVLPSAMGWPPVRFDSFLLHTSSLAHSFICFY